MVVNSAAHRALDGHRFDVRGPLDLGSPATSVVQVSLGDRLHEFTSGDLAFGRAWARDMGVLAFSEGFTTQGGRLRIGYTQVGDRGLSERILAAVWEGKRHSLGTHLYHAGTADAVRLFSCLTIREHEDGLSILPRTGTFAESAELLKEVPEIGLLEIATLNGRTAKRLPTWKGTATRAFELFQDTLTSGDPYFVLVNETTCVTVLPHAHAVPRMRQLADRLTVTAGF
ncbi:hypothetical protein [Rhizohabitans arisaemae]|uniref:hypothetical protein n=1 Tax=Rhizohabitans arisaemae TaxID=2720610 RepID=UPI0024B1C04F|nr:hypothetical protein [Rhizohabitans arisaemae]